MPSAYRQAMFFPGNRRLLHVSARSICLTLLLGGAAAVRPVSATVITIDNFTDPFLAETFYNTNGTAFARSGLEVGAWRLTPTDATVREAETQSQSGLSGVLGGLRTATLTRTAPVGSLSSARSATAGIEAAGWSHANSFATTSRAMLEYGSVADPLNADFSSLGTGGYFLLAGWSLDQGSVEMSLALTIGGVSESRTLVLTAAPFQSPVDHTIPFAEFGLIDFGDLDSIRLEFSNSGPAQDSTLRSFSARGIPVPDGGASTIVLVGLAFVGGITLGVRRRRT